ncbi:MAG: trimeric autotransporter adhesin, partial [Gemmatimonadaceae bacterium]|nr:trimeric autotransporter adhesin [Gemmatimonadaceae bacterium]
KVAIPDSTWKVALIGPRSAGVPFTPGSIQDWSDVAGVTVLAVNMPNVAGVRNDPWQKYLTTVDKIETATGYDFLSLLPVAFQDALEAGDHAPVALFGVSGTLNEGAPITFDASSSTDADLVRSDLGRTEALSYTWNFSDGDQASGKVVAKSFANNGTYTATVVVSDAFGWQSTTSHTVTVANVAPAIGGFAGATLLRGETYSASGSFSDPGADQWTGTVNFGDGPARPSIDLTGKSFTLSHTYDSVGSFAVVVSVSDGEATSTRSATVVVKSAAEGIDDLDATLSTLPLNSGEVNSLRAKLQAAAKQLAKDNPTPAKNILGAFINEMQAMMQSGNVGQADGSPIVAYAQRVIASIEAP